jgi:predicted MFS family arabinose efflux permease
VTIHCLTGCAIGATGFLLVDRLAPPGALTEAFGWLVTGTNAGVAIGAVIAGHVVERHGTDAGLAAAPLSAVLAFLVLLAGRRSLRPITSDIAEELRKPSTS